LEKVQPPLVKTKIWDLIYNKIVGDENLRSFIESYLEPASEQYCDTLSFTLLQVHLAIGYFGNISTLGDFPNRIDVHLYLLAMMFTQN
jgi:hypothetical protein